VDARRFSLVAHGDLPWWNPLDGEAFDRAVVAAAPPAGARILDVGCGNGALLARALRAVPGSTGVGVDRAILPGTVAAGAAFLEEEFAPTRWAPGSFDLVLCVGASHAAGGAAAALRALGSLVRPGGAVLLGEGFWEREPDAGYLDLLGATREELRDFAGTAGLGAAAGLEPVAAEATTREAWDRYEGAYAANVERFVAAHRADPDAAAMLARIRPWRAGYLRWGRTTLGFGLFVFRRPGADGAPEV
jgi:SAM-dependent methyltransferase